MFDAEHPTTSLLQLSVEGNPDSLFSLVDSLARKLLAGDPTMAGTRTRLEGIAALTTPSVTALKAYLDGEISYRAGRYADAVDAFERAVASDSNFSLAYYQLSIAADWAGTLPPSEVRRSADRARRGLARLSRREQLLLRAFIAWRNGLPDEAVSQLREATQEYPDDADAWYELGEVLFHTNPLRGRNILESQTAFQRVLALNGSHHEAMVHLLRLAALRDDKAAVDSFSRKTLSVATQEEGLEPRAFNAFAQSDSAAEERALSALHGANAQVLNTITWRIAVYARNIVGAERVARLMLNGDRQTRELAIWNLAHLELARGRWNAADSLFGESREGHALEDRAFYAAMPFATMTPARLAAFYDSLKASTTFLEQRVGEADSLAVHSRRVFVLGLISSRLGRSDLRRSIDWLDARADTTVVGQSIAQRSAVLRAEASLAKGQARKAQDELMRVRHSALSFAGEADQYQRYLRGTRAEKLNQHSTALGWYDGMGQLYVPELIFVAPAHLQQAAIYSRLGDASKAAEHYRAALVLWKDCDPPLRHSLLTSFARISTP